MFESRFGPFHISFCIFMYNTKSTYRINSHSSNIRIKLLYTRGITSTPPTWAPEKSPLLQDSASTSIAFLDCRVPPDKTKITTVDMEDNGPIRKYPRSSMRIFVREKWTCRGATRSGIWRNPAAGGRQSAQYAPFPPCHTILDLI